MILDEATSALDSESERIVQDAIEACSRETTVIAIAHRLATIRDFDRIVVMDNGTIIAEGTHTALWRSCNLYRDLWQFQASDMGPAAL